VNRKKQARVSGEQGGESEWVTRVKGEGSEHVTGEQGKGSKEVVSVIEMFQYENKHIPII
jgi:hypothetical protein